MTEDYKADTIDPAKLQDADKPRQEAKIGLNDEVLHQGIDFIANKGAVELLLMLQKEPKRFITLEEEMDITSATISQRLEDAQEVDFTDEGRNEKGQLIHELTPKGELIATELKVTDIDRIRRDIRKLEEEYEEKIDQFGEMLLDDKDRLERKYRGLVSGNYHKFEDISDLVD